MNSPREKTTVVRATRSDASACLVGRDTGDADRSAVFQKVANCKFSIDVDFAGQAIFLRFHLFSFSRSGISEQISR